LGAMMIDKKGVDDVIDILHSEVFYKESHQLITINNDHYILYVKNKKIKCKI
jgi:replicative DNA helicase